VAPAAAAGLPPATPRLQPLRGLLPYIGRYRGRVALALLFLLLAAGAMLALPPTVKLLVDGGLTQGGLTQPTAGAPDERLAAIRQHFLLLFGVSLLLGLATAARYYMVSWIGERVTTDLRQAVYAHVLRQSPQFFETLKTGEVLSRLSADATVIHHAVGSSVSMGLRNLVLLLGGLTMLLTTTPRLMLSVAGIIVLVVLPAVLIARRVRKLSRASQDRLADTGGIAGEVLNAVGVVQSYGREAAEAERFGRANEEAFAASMRRTGTRSALTAFVIIGVFASLLYGMYGGVRAVLGQRGAGRRNQRRPAEPDCALRDGRCRQRCRPGGGLGRSAARCRRHRAPDGTARRTFPDRLAAHSPIADPARPVSLAEPAGGLPLGFSQVQFAYPSRPTAQVLHGLELRIPAGQTVALVGPSGAGKTTIFQLLQRFYDVAGGAIQVDGVDLRRLSLAELRRRIAVVPQEAVIFSGSIADNIAYGRPGASPDEIRAAAGAAFVDDFVRRLPEGYDTFVGERGLRLSGGQRQRIAIARAMLKNAPLLLLDEATSSLDAESERVVQAALEIAMAGRTTIVIAHRLATVQRADRIIVLDHGRVVEDGTHTLLVAKDGLYARLAALQFAA